MRSRRSAASRGRLMDMSLHAVETDVSRANPETVDLAQTGKTGEWQIIAPDGLRGGNVVSIVPAGKRLPPENAAYGKATGDNGDSVITYGKGCWDADDRAAASGKGREDVDDRAAASGKGRWDADEPARNDDHLYKSDGNETGAGVSQTKADDNLVKAGVSQTKTNDNHVKVIALNDKYKDIRGTEDGKRKAGLSFLKTFLIGFLLLLLVLVPAQFGLVHLLGQPIIAGSEILPDDIKIVSADPESPYYDVYKKADRVNILLLGINGGLSDTMMLGSYDMEAQRIDIISIPRDTYYERPKAKTKEQRKANAIYGNEGAEGAARAVSSILGGIPVHYYAVVKYKGVEKAVDAIGGVPVYIPFNMDYDDPYDKPPLSIHFKKGAHVLNGKDSVKFLRFRKNNPSVGGGYPDQDIGRIKAQQEFMKAAFKKSIGLNLPKVVSIIIENVESDLTNGIALKLAAKITDFDMENIYSHTLPGVEKNIDRLSYWLYDKDETEKMVNDIYQPEEDETSGAAISAAAHVI